jgi:hypothetical protein
MQNNTGIVAQNNPLTLLDNESIFNKTCNEITNRLIGETKLPNKITILSSNDLATGQLATGPQVSVPLVEQPVNIQNGGTLPNIENISMPLIPNNSVKSPYYSILGYEFSLWTLILVLLILITIIYFLYRWYFSSDNKVVTVKKSNQLVKSINPPNEKKLNEEIKKLNEEITDSESSDSDSESSSSSSSSSSSKSKNPKLPSVKKQK